MIVSLSDDGGDMSMKSISSRQITAAMALLRWNSKDLAEASGVATVTIWRKTGMDGPITGDLTTVTKIVDALECAGIEFTNGVGTEGVRRRI